MGWAVAAPAPLPDHEQAAQDGRTLAGLLTTEQLSRYAGSTDREQVARSLAGERAEVLRSRHRLTPTGEEREALDTPWQPSPRSEWLRQTWHGVWSAAAVLALLGFLVVFVRPGLGFFLLLFLTFLSIVGLTGEWVTIARQDRARVDALLDWATTRPGQLGRGVPGSAPRATVSGSLDMLTYTVLSALLVPFLIGVMMVVIIALVALALFLWKGWTGPMVSSTYLAWLIAALVVPVVAGSVVLLALRRGSLSERRRASALEWLVPHDAGVADDEPPTAVGPAPDEAG